jgi:hypothetical protein
MLIAHEAPMKIMPFVQSQTDYDYCLVHLLEESEEYLNFFIKAKKDGRKIIMDCSLFELGTAFDPEKYYFWIKYLQPDEYIVPDVWQDCEANIKSYQDFSKNFNLSRLEGKRIGVLQGKSFEDFVKGYDFMKSNADKIAVSFGYDFYLDNWRDTISNKAEIFSRGRINLIDWLVDNNVIDPNIPHHLLGCGVPTEFEHYTAKSYEFVESIDTSHPVLSGFFGKSYKSKKTLQTKIPQKMVDIFDEEVSSENLKLIEQNIQIFRKICRPK